MTDPKPCDCNPEIQHLIRDMHLALLGNEELGVNGVIKEIAELKRWRRNLDIRVAAIAGSVTASVLVLKTLWVFR